MDYTLEEKYARIREDALAAVCCDPVRIAHEIMRRDYINMHGPEHHFLDGAAFLAAYRNAGGEIDLDKALDELAKRTVKMPGAMCGQWGICGSAASVGAALAVIRRGDRALHRHGALAAAAAPAAGMRHIHAGALQKGAELFLPRKGDARFAAVLNNNQLRHGAHSPNSTMPKYVTVFSPLI